MRGGYGKVVSAKVDRTALVEKGVEYMIGCSIQKFLAVR